MNFARLVKHLAVPHWAVRRAFPPAVLARIESAITTSERAHRGEIRFAVEGGIDLLPLLKGLTPRERALQVFSELRVWDTEENSGVLVYVQLVDRHIEIIADRGVHAKVPQPEWDRICARMEEAFHGGRYEQGMLSGIEEITALLARHFPARSVNPDELPDAPVTL
jgi:uncharacterized membrane protein